MNGRRTPKRVAGKTGEVGWGFGTEKKNTKKSQRGRQKRVGVGQIKWGGPQGRGELNLFAGLKVRGKKAIRWERDTLKLRSVTKLGRLNRQKVRRERV